MSPVIWYRIELLCSVFWWDQTQTWHPAFGSEQTIYCSWFNDFCCHNNRNCHFSPILSQHCILSFSLFLLYKIMCSLWFMFSIQLACLLLDATCCAIFCQYYEISKPKKFLHSMKKPSNKLKLAVQCYSGHVDSSFPCKAVHDRWQQETKVNYSFPSFLSLLSSYSTRFYSMCMNRKNSELFSFSRRKFVFEVPVLLSSVEPRLAADTYFK